MEKKKQIGPTLRAMKLHDSEDFSLDNYMSINAAIHVCETQNAGKKFTRKRNNETRTLRVTRIA